jgi:hypothetical protein
MIFCVIAIALPTAAFAAGDESNPTHWWQVVTGILAIPTAIGAIVLGYATLKKTRLESKKIELELLEKRATIANMPSAASPEANKIAQSLIDPLIENNRVNYLILRFVVIYLLFEFWQIFEKAFGLVAGGTMVTLQELFKVSVSGVPTMIFFGLSQVVQVGWIILVLLLGLPLYRDISAHIGFRLLGRSSSQ